MKVTLSLNPQGEVVVDLTPAQRELLGLADQTIPVKLIVDSASSITDEDFETAVSHVMERHHGLFEALAKT